MVVYVVHKHNIVYGVYSSEKVAKAVARKYTKSRELDGCYDTQVYVEAKTIKD